MSDWRILDDDCGVKTFHKVKDGKTIIKSVQDVQPILDTNTALKAEANKGWKGDIHHVASIPKVVVASWWKELGSNPFAKENRAWLIARLNNRDWSKLRTKEGNL